MNQSEVCDDIDNNYNWDWNGIAHTWLFLWPYDYAYSTDLIFPRKTHQAALCYRHIMAGSLQKVKQEL